MKYLIYSSSSIAYPHFGVQLEECEKLNAQGHSVTFAYCDGVNNTCFKNINSNQTNILNPEIRIYDKPKTLTYEAAIKTSLIKDYYLTMSNIDRSDYYNIKFQKKPLMAWIWISVIMIVIGGSIRLFSNAKNN